MISRRKFFHQTLQGLGAAALLPAVHACNGNASPTVLAGPSAALGHRLRDMNFPPVSSTLRTGIAVIGGGVSGLSAGRYLRKFTNDFLVLELENTTGGNASSGTNAVSAYPRGAHYLPLPGNEDPELVAFMQEAGCITGFQDGLPVYNDLYLCHDPKERLYINNLWQEGIVPHEGVPRADRDEIDRFLSWMRSFKEKKGSDGKFAFGIPIDESSSDPEFRKLDAVSADAFLEQNGYRSPYLRWYVQYCCADDYGTSLSGTSAWAMTHYFASRKGVAANAASDAVLTWPQGNFWLTEKMRSPFESNIRCNMVAWRVDVENGKVKISAFDATKNISVMIEAEKAILATPQFVNARIVAARRDVDLNAFQYAPWIVANMTLRGNLNEKRGEHLSWDNVIYGSNALGYVNATHQSLSRPKQETVITYYRPLIDMTPSNARKLVYTESAESWRRSVVADLKVAHPDIDRAIVDMEIWRWGHAMIMPSPGFIWSAARHQASQPVHGNIFFANADVAGISIFEEAFYRGHQCARKALAS